LISLPFVSQWIKCLQNQWHEQTSIRLDSLRWLGIIGQMVRRVQEYRWDKS
jgi:hypothetical protein